MRILILSLSDKRHMPMIATYINYLESKKISYDIICSNRYAERQTDFVDTNDHGNVYEINMLFEPATSKLKKIMPFLLFREKALQIIKQRKYSFIIVWNENTAAVFSTFLARKFRNRYCINIRDIYTHQLGVRQLVDLSINNACFVTVPSPEMNTKRPEKTLCVYNKDLRLMNLMNQKSSFQVKDKPIRITHLGFYFKVQKGAQNIVDALGNDERFELYFIGQGFDTEFREYIEKRGYKNVKVAGAFPYEDTAKYLNNTDIINSYYNRFEHPSLQVSFGIKHSYTPMLCIPGIADENTCWGRLSRKYGIAYLINDKNICTLADDLYEWYRNLDFEEFKEKCLEFNELIDGSISDLYEKLDLLMEDIENE